MPYNSHIVIVEDRKGSFHALIFSELMTFEKPSASVRVEIITRIHCFV